MKDVPTGIRHKFVKPRLIAARDAAREKGKRFNRSPAAIEREALYKSREWRELRAIVLREEPLCAECGAPSQHADHIEHGADWRSRFFDRANLRGLCSRCHNSKSAKDLAASKKKVSPYERFRKPS